VTCCHRHVPEVRCRESPRRMEAATCLQVEMDAATCPEDDAEAATCPEDDAEAATRVPRRFAMEEFDKPKCNTANRIEEDMLEHSLAWGGRV